MIRLLILSALATALVAIIACDSEGVPGDSRTGGGNWTIEDTRQFREFSLYWLGESYQGLPLTKITRYRYGAEDSVAFLYGDCTPSADGGCPPPIQVIVEPYCMGPPEQLAAEVKEGPPAQVRGALAQPAREGDLIIYTGDVTIQVFDSRGISDSAVEVAQALEAVAPGGPRAGEPLPPAHPSSC